MHDYGKRTRSGARRLCLWVTEDWHTRTLTHESIHREEQAHSRQSRSGGEMVVLLRTHLPISLTASMVPIGSLYPRLPKNTTHVFTRDLKGKCVFDA